MKLKKILLLSLTFFCCANIVAQDKGVFSGDLQFNSKFFEADSARNAINTPFYDYLHYGAEAWLQLNYSISGFDMGLRFDMFANSNIFTPTREVSEQGIGRWYISKSINKLHITVGHIYQQYGSGITLRSYEARPLGIDQAIMGVKLSYDITDQWQLTGFTGRQKNIFDLYKPVLKGINLNGYVQLSDNVSIAPGISAVGRTIDTETMQTIALEINGYPLDERFEPKYNNYTASIYNRLDVGRISWYAEAAGKTEDVIRNIDGLLFNPDLGYVFYSSLGYSQKGLGVILQGKYTKDFDFRVSPNEAFNRGVINYLPSLTQQNSGRLRARYNAATQFLGELAFQGDVIYTPKRGVTINANYSDVRNLDKDLLFREAYLEFIIKLKKRKWKLSPGIQFVDYNQAVFEQKGDFVNTFTPFTEFVYKFDRKKSLKMEFSYMMTERNRRLFGMDEPKEKQDLGDWLWGLAEFSIAPHWSFSVADMYNFNSNLHYPTFFVSYSEKATRFALSYAKQPDGIVCTGGVCRFEPAFSGLRFDVTTSF